MLEMNITITAADLAAAINNLAAALAANRQTPADKPANPTPANIAPPAAPPVNNAPAPAPIQTAPVGYPQQPAAPGVPLSATPAPTAAPAAVPTAAPTYTLEMIATAGTALVDAGKMDLLCNLLTKYGIDSITKLDPAQYGVFATELRSLGAQI